MDSIRVVQAARSAYDSKVKAALNSRNYRQAQIEVFNICLYLGSRTRGMNIGLGEKCLAAANSIAQDVRASRRTSIGLYEALEAYLGQLELSMKTVDSQR